MAEHDEELKRKMAEFAGFEEADIKKHYYWAIGGQRCAKWQEPNTGYHVRLPNFPNDLNACFKCLVPKLCDRLADVYNSTVDEAYQRLFNLWLEEMSHHEPPLALCLAIEKLMDMRSKHSPENKGKPI